jgi:hypothetical protein
MLQQHVGGCQAAQGSIWDASSPGVGGKRGHSVYMPVVLVQA